VRDPCLSKKEMDSRMVQQLSRASKQQRQRIESKQYREQRNATQQSKRLAIRYAIQAASAYTSRRFAAATRPYQRPESFAMWMPAP
jgi:phosphopantetheinyl transferase